MRLERQSGRRPESLGLPEQLLVSEMDAIEISEGHGVPANRTVRLDDSLEEFHPKWVYPNHDSMGRVSLQPDPVGQEFVGRATPPDWTEVFGFDGPLELELGAGMGGFAIEYAAQFPNVRYVAFEWRRKFAREAHRRAAARAEVPRLFAAGSLSVIHLQFPDPWWKRSHQKRSLVQADFSRLLYQLLAPGGLLDFRTDVEDRARRMIAALEASGFVNPLGPGALHPRQADEIPSAREQRYLATGAPVYRAKLGKPSHSGPADRGP
jgi:tRNA (guanine-N7-)-methyltransferase